MNVGDNMSVKVWGTYLTHSPNNLALQLYAILNNIDIIDRENAKSSPMRGGGAGRGKGAKGYWQLVHCHAD